MPRNASGQYTLPVGNPVIADTLIESDGWANPTMEDLGAEIEDSLSRDGKGSMRAALGIVDGSQANPGLRFIAETGSGLYRASDGEWWLTVKGVGKIQLTESAGLLLADAVTIAGDATVNGDSTMNGNLVIIGQDDIVQLIVTGDLGQTVDLQQWQNSLGEILASVDKDGDIAVFGLAPNVFTQRILMENAPFVSKFTKFTEEDTGGFVDIQYEVFNTVPDPDYFARFRYGRDTIVDELKLEVLQGDGSETPAFDVDTSTPGDFTTVGSRRRSGAQTANMHEWRDEAGVVMAAIDKDGQFIGGPGGSGTGGSTPDNIGNVPVGAIMHWPLNPPDLGTEWLICDGTSFLVATFPALHAYLGDAYGGDGGTNFNVPDYRGNFLRGQDSGAGVDPDAGTRTDRGDGTTGDNPGTRQAFEVQSHLHSQGGVFPHSSVNIPTGANPRQLGFGAAGGTDTGLTGGAETRPVNVYTVIAIKAV
jgi:hypothetical protein